MNQSSRHRNVFIHVALFTFGVSLVFARPLLAQSTKPLIRRQSSRPLLAPPIAPLTMPQEEGQNELVLPQVTPEIVGRWGGHLYLLTSDGSLRPSPLSPISLLFGRHRDGTVYVQTGVWGSSASQLVRVSAQVVDPRKIKILDEHLVTVGSQIWRVTQKDTLILKNMKVMDCLESVQVYDEDTNSLAGVYIRPQFSAILHGSLHIIGDEEEGELHAELLQQGAVPQANVEGSNNFDR